MRRAILLAPALAALLAAPAHASTLVNAGGTLTFTGDGAAVNHVSFAGGPRVVVTVQAGDADPIGAPAGCTIDNPGLQYSCDGVTQVNVVAGGGADTVN